MTWLGIALSFRNGYGIGDDETHFPQNIVTILLPLPGETASAIASTLYKMPIA